MKKQLLAVGIFLFSFVLPVKTDAATFNQIYAFGDSLTDNGNLFAASGDTFPPYPYYEGRISNGPVWVEYLAKDWGIKLNDFAYAGATTGTQNVVNQQYPQIQLPPLPGLSQEVQSFVGNNPFADSQALYIIWAGTNDYLGGGITNPSVPVTNLLNSVTSLASVGAKNFLIVNLPNLGSIPATQGTANSENLNLLTGLYNSALSQTFNLFSQQKPNLDIQIFDVNSFFNEVTNNKQEFGLTNVTDACLNITAQTICSNPNQYLFWDSIHPTTYADSLIAKEVEKEIPESSTTLSLLAVATLILTGFVKRKYQIK
jgi:phospholipase/lecithinase/hemolysin